MGVGTELELELHAVISYLMRVLGMNLGPLEEWCSEPLRHF